MALPKDKPCRALRVPLGILLLGAVLASPLSCRRSVPPSGHSDRLAATVRELELYRRSWGVSAVPRLAEALALAQNDQITRKPFLYDATLNWEERDQKRGWLAVFWLKTTDPSERYLVPGLILQIRKDGKPAHFEIQQPGSWAVPWGYFWKRQVRFTIVPGEGIEQSVAKEGQLVELKIGEQELAHEMLLGIQDADGYETDKLRVRTIKWWER